jgi:hypothetical protein
MPSQQTEGKLRIADGLVVIALSAFSLLTIWRTPADVVLLFQSRMPALLVFWGGVILVGRTRAGRLVRSRRRWRYLALLGVVSFVVIVTIVGTSHNPERPGADLSLRLFPPIVALFVAQLYEREDSAQFKAADLSDRDAQAWKRIAYVPAALGTFLGCLASVTIAAGDTVIWIVLSSRNRQLRAKP